MANRGITRYSEIPIIGGRRASINALKNGYRSLMAGGIQSGGAAVSMLGSSGIPTDLLTLNPANAGVAGYKYWDYDAAFEGSARFPPDSFGGIAGDNLNYCPNPAIAIGSQPGRIFIAGRDRGEATTTIAEFQLPTLSTSATLSSLPLCTNTQPFREILTAAPVDGESWSGRMVGPIANINGKLLVSAYGYYTGTNRPFLVINDPANLATSAIRGYYDGVNRQRGGGWCSPIPAPFQAVLGGTHLMGFSMSQTRAILTKYSIGPSANVYNANASDSIFGATPLASGSTISTVAGLDYPIENGLTPEANLGNAGTLWTSCSGGQYGFIFPGTKTYLVIGASGGHVSGASYFDPAPYDANFKGYGPNDPDDIYNYFWAFNVDSIILALLMNINPWEILPYEQGIFSPRHDGGSGWFSNKKIGGIAQDEANNKLLISLAYADGTQASESYLPVVDQYSMELAA